MTGPIPTNARLATLDQLLATIVTAYFNPTPKRDTFRNWLDAAGIPRYKPNPVAKRGGGSCFYSVPAVEKMLRQRTMAKVRTA